VNALPISREEFLKLPKEWDFYPREFTDIVIRKSEYMSWRNCPKAFEFQYIQGIKPEIGIEAEIGREAHIWMHDFFDRVDFQELRKIRSFQSAYKLFKQMLPDQPILRSYCDNFIKFEAAEWERLCKTKDPLKYWVPVARELELHVDSVGFIHHVDRIDLLPSGGLIIIEYKPKIRTTAIREELSFYTIGVLASKKFDLPVTHIGCYGYATAEAKSWPVKSKMLHRVAKYVREMRLQIKAYREGKKDVFVKRPSMKCAWCWYNSICQPGGEVDEEVESD